MNRLERRRDLLLMSVWFGLITSMGELFQLAFRKYIEHKELFLSPHVLWLAPLSHVMLFLLVAGLLIAAALAWSRLRSARFAITVFTFLSALSLLLMYDRLHSVASLVLAAGIAVNVSTFVIRRADGFATVLRRTTPVLGGLAVLALFGVGGTRIAREKVAIAAIPPARTGSPNIVLIIWDTVRSLSVSAQGYARRTTPNLELLAQRGIFFDAAMSTSPWTLPSHASMFTGHYPHELSTDFPDPLDETFPTLAEILTRHGYITAGFVGNTLYCGAEYGLARGFAHYEDFRVGAAELVLSSAPGRVLSENRKLRKAFGFYDVFGRKSARVVTDDFLDWLPATTNRPFFAFLNYYDAHEPYLPPYPYREEFGPQKNRRLDGLDYSQLRHATRWGKRNMGPAERQMEEDAYDGAISYLDSELARLIESLERRGLLENTLVIVTSDHGEHLGEAHNQKWGHGSTLYMQELHVPLLIIPPGGTTATRVQTPVSLRDLAATVLDLSVGNHVDVPGASLARYWDPRVKASDMGSSPVVSQYWERTDAMKSIVLDPYHYIKTLKKEEAFDVRRDPHELNDLIASSALPLNILNTLRTAAAPWPSRNRHNARR